MQPRKRASVVYGTDGGDALGISEIATKAILTKYGKLEGDDGMIKRSKRFRRCLPRISVKAREPFTSMLSVAAVGVQCGHLYVTCCSRCLAQVPHFNSSPSTFSASPPHSRAFSTCRLPSLLDKTPTLSWISAFPPHLARPIFTSIRLLLECILASHLPLTRKHLPALARHFRATLCLISRLSPFLRP